MMSRCGVQLLAGAPRRIVKPVCSPSQALTSASTPLSDELEQPVSPPWLSPDPAGPRTQLHGRIDLITGPMFAGKTSELVRRVQLAQAAGKRVLVLKSSKDNRFGAISSLVTHDGVQTPCLASSSLQGVVDGHPEQYEAADVIAIDEAQFFPPGDLLAFVVNAAEKDHKAVIASGLTIDFERQQFGQLLNLVPMADTISQLSGRCYVHGCHRPSLFSMRLPHSVQLSEEQELVGGAEMYQPACRMHYLRHKKP
ncbi:hypothetical protein QJQ45_015690 [Haematococcus lacustris]|nr:hypothetical protein QJQ45_015690 [Haematococcus lacustris]